MKFTIYDLNTAPEKSKPLLQNSLSDFGMIPNLHGVLAESPEALQAYQTLHNLFQKTSFDKDELTVIWQTINAEHQCHYCLPAHFAVAMSMGVGEELITALKNKTALPNAKLEVLKETTLILIRNRGNITKEELAEFVNAGYTKQNVMEILVGIAQKVMSNYANHIAETPVDEPFKKFI